MFCSSGLKGAWLENILFLDKTGCKNYAFFYLGCAQYVGQYGAQTLMRDKVPVTSDMEQCTGELMTQHVGQCTSDRTTRGAVSHNMQDSV